MSAPHAVDSCAIQPSTSIGTSGAAMILDGGKGVVFSSSLESYTFPSRVVMLGLLVYEYVIR